MKARLRVFVVAAVCGLSWAMAGIASAQFAPAVQAPVPVIEPQQPQPATPFPADARPALPPSADSIPSPMGGDAIGPEEAKPLKDCFRLRMKDGSLIVGDIADDVKLTLRAKFGEVEIALREIALIERAVEDDEFQVTMTNGDRLTGRPKLEDAKMKTAWGEVPLQLGKGLIGLEAGKLGETTTYSVRHSPDGRSTVAIARKQSVFQPLLQNAGPCAPAGSYPTTAPSVSVPVPTPHRWPMAVPGASYGVPTAPAPVVIQPQVRNFPSR